MKCSYNASVLSLPGRPIQQTIMSSQMLAAGVLTQHAQHPYHIKMLSIARCTAY